MSEMVKKDGNQKENLLICPESERLVGFVERTLTDSEMRVISLHLRTCQKCQELVRDYAVFEIARKDAESGEVPEDVSKEVEQAIQSAKHDMTLEMWRSMGECFAPQREFLAAADGQSADQLQHEAAVKSGFLHFASKKGVDADSVWHVKLARPSVISDECVLRFYVESRDSKPVDQGVLAFGGVELEVKGGRALIPIKTFRDNLKIPVVALRIGTGKDVPGELLPPSV